MPSLFLAEIGQQTAIRAVKYILWQTILANIYYTSVRSGPATNNIVVVIRTVYSGCGYMLSSLGNWAAIPTHTHTRRLYKYP